MKVTKRIAALAAAALMVASLGVFTGCSADAANEEVIRTSIASELDPYKNHDSSVISQIQQQNAVAIATVGMDCQEYAKALLDGFDYSIEDVTVNGKEATATIVMTQKDIDETEAETIMEELANDPEFMAMSQDERKTAVSDRIFEYIESVEAAPQEPVTLEFVLNGNTWEPTEASATRLQSLFTF